jgi:biopolymer transport protein ExbD
MAFQLHGPDDEMAETHEINVTPFIDVILVLLIIFMVAAPLATVDVPVDLPAAQIAPQPRPDTPLFLTLRTDHTLLLGEAPTGRDALGAAIDAQTGADHTQRIFLRADRAVSYGEMMEVMNLLRGSGYLKVALVALESMPSP